MSATPRRGKTRHAPSPMGQARYRVMLGLVLIGLALLAGRIVDLHVFDRTFLQGQGDARTLRVDPIPAHRGMITDRHGEPLAISTPVVTLWANPQDLPDDRIQRLRLAQALGQEPEALNARIERYADREFMYLRRRMTPVDAQEVLDLRIPGVHKRAEYKRYYPAGEVIAQLIGVTNIDDQGQEGLELAYQSYLSGEPGRRRVLKDRRGRLVRDLEVLQEAEPGGDLTLAIDQRLQYMAYRELKSAVDENDADGGVLVMLDADTGEVLAMANQPSYNPNNRAGLDPGGLRNRAIVDVFEPGSVMKPLAMSALLETGRFPPDTVVDTSPGWMVIDGYTIKDVANYGELTLSGILEKSSNIGMSKLTLQLDDPVVPERYRALGFDQVPGTGFPGEAGGSVPAPQVWSSSQWAALSYGYGLSVSALQLAGAYTAIANHGERLPPSLLRLNRPPAGEPVIEPDVADRVLGMMDRVVEPGTGARRALVPGYSVAGKTGTVRKSGGGGYEENAYRSLFVGIAPVSDPRLITVVMIDHPRGDAFYGGAVAAPVFSRVAGSALRLLDVPPDLLDEDS
ncbi:MULTISPECIES: peptidoglycan D,D-transpeptidase FtsI family protein [Halomonas]|uniref:Peptidoglycan D,D-transpeptidase FtsI n=1 Tax=Halomonas halophila TaxID=29573 RepID=A0ABQ0TZL2_9GAMM|nr:MULTISPECIES: penicillin-binding transpeptidase domain-containing protein [Halomonas]MDR5889533.1 penicillin-binding transpeptidase domain-containing protein [Halomonas salina]WJY06215.1 penicillin-binding transpeptidase domain-containing protein [Halomonas halophila]GEK71701.1 penicillin-binding protein 3 [Halomonas halophila]